MLVNWILGLDSIFWEAGYKTILGLQQDEAHIVAGMMMYHIWLFFDWGRCADQLSVNRTIIYTRTLSTSHIDDRTITEKHPHPFLEEHDGRSGCVLVVRFALASSSPHKYWHTWDPVNGTYSWEKLVKKEYSFQGVSSRTYKNIVI